MTKLIHAATALALLVALGTLAVSTSAQAAPCGFRTYGGSYACK